MATWFGTLLQRFLDITPSGEGMDVFIQSNTSNLFRAFLQTYDKTDITLTADVAVNAYKINVSASHGITAGMMLIIYNSDYFWQVEVQSVNVNEITVRGMASMPFTVAGTTIIRGSADMNVNGGTIATPLVYKFGIPSANFSPVDNTRAIIVMNHSADTGDDLYGGITALTNGTILRKENAVIENLGTYRMNRDFRLTGAKVSPIDKPPAGVYGTEINFYLQGQENFDQVIRIAYGDELKAYLRDPLGALLFKRIAVIGSLTSGE